MALPDVSIAPLPEGEPASSLYQVTVNGSAVPVYVAKSAHGGDYAFASFAFSGTVAVTITGVAPMQNVEVLPASAGITARREPGKLTLSLSRPCQLSIEPAGIRAPLVLLAETIEALPPEADAPNVVYFGPGVHTPGVIRLTSDQTLYLAAGAVVKGAVIVGNASNVLICGRGVLDSTGWLWKQGPCEFFMDVRNSSQVTIQDITLRGAFHWCLVLSRSRDVTIRNVKILNSRVPNDDAIDICNSQDVLIENCFVRCDDDCIAIKGLSTLAGNTPAPIRNIRIRNCIFWCDRARIFLLGHESAAPAMEDIVVSDCDIIHYVMTPFLLEPGEEMPLRNVSFQNIRLRCNGQEDLVGIHPTVNQYMQLQRPGRVKTIDFRDIAVEGAVPANRARISVSGADEQHCVEDVIFAGFTVNGQAVTADSPNVTIGRHAMGVRFSAP